MQLKYLGLFLIPFIIVLTSCQNNMKNPNEAKYRSVFIDVNKILDGGELNELDNNIANIVVDHQLDTAITKKPGLEGIKEMFSYYHKVFPDMKTTIHSMAVTGDTLFAYITSTGTSTAPFMGMPAHRKISFNGVDIVRFENGKIVEHWGFVNANDMMKMLRVNLPTEELEH